MAQLLSGGSMHTGNNIGTGSECCCVAGDICADSLIVCIAVSSALASARLDADLRAKLN